MDQIINVDALKRERQELETRIKTLNEIEQFASGAGLVKRGRGRPRGSVSERTGAKRGRGRPKGSTNKRKNKEHVGQPVDG